MLFTVLQYSLPYEALQYEQMLTQPSISREIMLLMSERAYNVVCRAAGFQPAGTGMSDVFRFSHCNKISPAKFSDCA